MTRAARLRRGTALGVFVAACVGIFLFLLNLAGGVSFGDSMRFQAVARNAVLLANHADVRVAGVVVGRVEHISLRGATAVLDLSVRPHDVTVHRDAHIRIATKTPTGENYVDLDPGSAMAPVLHDGAVLPLASTRTAVQVDQLLSTLPEARRVRLRHMIQGLDAAVGDHAEDLNGTLEGFSAIFRRGAPVAQVLATQRESVAGLVDDLGSVMAALGARDVAVRSLVRDGTSAATAIALEDSALRATLRALPGTLTAARATTRQLASTGTDVGPVLDDLGATLTALTPAARKLPATAGATLSALVALRRAVPRVGQTLLALRRTAPTAGALVRPADQVLRHSRAALDYNVPFTPDLVNVLALLGEVTRSRDAVGNYASLTAIITDELYQGLGPAQRKVLDGLAAAGVTKIVQHRFNGYPSPGKQFAPDAVSAFRRLQPDPPLAP